MAGLRTAHAVGVVVVVLAACATGAPVATGGEAGLRLIATAPGETAWMSPAEIDALLRAGVGFADVTRVPPVVPRPVRPTAGLPREPTHQRTVHALLADLDITRWNATVAHLSSYANRNHNTALGIEAAEWVVAEMGAVADRAPAASARAFVHPDFPQVSALARIEGSGAPDEVVVLTSHLDSLSFIGNAPGADDNASGTATVLEVFTALVEAGFQPRRSVEFHAYAAEERGLLGSRDVAADYAASRADVVAVINFDMTCYPGQDGSREIGLVRDFTDDALSEFVGYIIDEYLDPEQATYTNSECGYACSDHAPWDEFGYPAAFPFEARAGNTNPAIHTPADLLENCDLAYANEFLKLGLAAVVELAS